MIYRDAAELFEVWWPVSWKKHKWTAWYKHEVDFLWPNTDYIYSQPISGVALCGARRVNFLQLP